MLPRAFTLIFLLACSSFAAVTRVEIADRGDVVGGYERVAGKIYFAVDPKLAPNRIIADIDLAPRDSAGKVEFSADFYILRPRDAAKSNGTALVEITNRGGKGLLGMFDLASGSTDPRTPAEFGDNFLLEHGFTLVWIGWEFDVPPNPRLLHLFAPVATDHGKSITGLVLSEWEGDRSVTTISLGDRNQVAYSVADPNDAANRMFVRDTANGERRTIARSKWTFSDDTHVRMDDGFEPGKIYEIVYRAKDPVVAGLGPAAIRDLVAFLKHGGAETALGDPHIQRAIGFGVSQSGRFLRTFLYYGFNQDEQKRQVFDGVWAHVAGAGRGSFNERFAQPSRDGHPFLNLFYPVDIPPFNEADGIFARPMKDGVMPKLFLSNGSYEYWGRAASLIHTSEDGKQDVTPGKDTRIYFFAGSQHGSGSIPPRKVEAVNTASVNDYRMSMRALLLAMQGWIKDGKEPPASQYPQIGKDQLVAASALAFPKIVDLATPRHKREAYRLDFSALPPKAGPAYPSLVPQVDLDGNETSGIRMPEIAVPLASNTGWNLRSKTIGAPDELFSMVGSWIPFPVNQTEGENNKDPRLSIQERYKNKRDYLERITTAAQKLVQSGYLLDQDIPKVRDRAAKEWDYVLRSN